MRECLLWYDNEPGRNLNDKVKQAAARYKHRLQQQPTVCYINPAQFDATTVNKIGRIDLKPASHVLPHHYWISREQSTPPE